MIKLNKFFTISLVIFLSLLSVPTIVLARDGDNGTTTITSTTTSVKTTLTKTPEMERTDDKDRTTSTDDKKVDKTDLPKPKTFNDRCQVVEKHSDDLSDKFTRGRDDNIQHFNKAVSTLGTLSSKLKEKGISTTNLDSEITVLKQKIQKYNDDVTVLANYLMTVKKDVCTNTTTLTLPPLKTSNETKSAKARQLMGVLKSDMDDIKNYFKNTIKPTLESLKKSIQESETPKPSVSITLSTSLTPTISITPEQ